MPHPRYRTAIVGTGGIASAHVEPCASTTTAPS